LIRLIKWEFEYTLFAFQDELVDRLLFIKDKIFLKHYNKYKVEITGKHNCKMDPTYSEYR
jgi:hypothetical protein